MALTEDGKSRLHSEPTTEDDRTLAGEIEEVIQWATDRFRPKDQRASQPFSEAMALDIHHLPVVIRFGGKNEEGGYTQISSATRVPHASFYLGASKLLYAPGELHTSAHYSQDGATEILDRHEMVRQAKIDLSQLTPVIR